MLRNLLKTFLNRFKWLIGCPRPIPRAKYSIGQLVWFDAPCDGIFEFKSCAGLGKIAAIKRTRYNDQVIYLVKYDKCKMRAVYKKEAELAPYVPEVKND